MPTSGPPGTACAPEGVHPLSLPPRKGTQCFPKGWGGFGRIVPRGGTPEGSPCEGRGQLGASVDRERDGELGAKAACLTKVLQLGLLPGFTAAAQCVLGRRQQKSQFRKTSTVLYAAESAKEIGVTFAPNFGEKRRRADVLVVHGPLCGRPPSCWFVKAISSSFVILESCHLSFLGHGSLARAPTPCPVSRCLCSYGHPLRGQTFWNRSACSFGDARATFVRPILRH